LPATPLTRICYVEDDEDIRRIVRLALEKVGKMTVEVVGDPTAAIEAITAFRPDLVMLDWMMPAMDGPTLFRQMKLRPETSSLPVVFITAKASQRELDELMAMGAAGAISKPFSPKDLPDQLRAIWAKLPSRVGAASRRHRLPGRTCAP
jgi:two-component system, OmpR family, response regulator